MENSKAYFITLTIKFIVSVIKNFITKNFYYTYNKFYCKCNKISLNIFHYESN